MKELSLRTKVISKRANGRLRVQSSNNLPTRTQQQHKNECDINQIMKKYIKTGLITHLNQKAGGFRDLTEVPDYQQALDTVIQAQQAFGTLSAELRYKFKNDPHELIEFLKDEKNNEEAYKYGLKVRPKDPEVTLADINKTLKDSQKIKVPKAKVVLETDDV